MENKSEGGGAVSDCAVCKKMQKLKYRRPQTALIIALFVVSIIAVVFMVLYLADGNIGTTNEVNIEIENELDNGSTSNIVTGDNSTINGKIEVKDNSAIYLSIAIICGCLIIAGSVIYVSQNRRQNRD